MVMKTQVFKESSAFKNVWTYFSSRLMYVEGSL